MTVYTGFNLISYKKSHHKGEAVPAYGERTYMKPHRVSRPCDEIKHCESRVKFFTKLVTIVGYIKNLQ